MIRPKIPFLRFNYHEVRFYRSSHPPQSNALTAIDQHVLRFGGMPSTPGLNSLTLGPTKSIGNFALIEAKRIEAENGGRLIRCAYGSFPMDSMDVRDKHI